MVSDFIVFISASLIYLLLLLLLTALTDSTGHLVKADWFVGMLSALAFIIILAVLVCVVQRNRGGKYAVHEKEIAQGRGLEYDHDGFDEYPSKP